MDFHVTAEQEALQQVCQRLAADFATRAAQHDRESSLPLENYTALQRAGLYGLTVPKALGGGGAGFLSWTLAAEALAQGCPATALTFTMHVAGVEWLFDDPLFSPAVRQRVAALAVHDQKLIAFALSEASSSSLLGGPTFIPSVQAHRVSGGYTLRGRKAFLSMIEGCDYTFLTAHPAEAANPWPVLCSSCRIHSQGSVSRRSGIP